MWLPSQIPAQAEVLRGLGLSIDVAALSDPTSGVLGAVVNFGGCSAAFISADGLIATNHHCAVRALEYNSVPEKNLLETGFLAATRKDERGSGPTARVLTTLSMRDVTDEVRASLAAAKDDLARQLAFEKQQKEQVARCESGRPGMRCQLVSFYEGLKYAVVERLELRDVRIVYAPPDGIGNFGGEVDNWRWPRHTGDFALFRAYVAKDGSAADHSSENVPYRPAHFLPLSTSALSSGDLVLVAGYPARTARLKLRREIEDVMTWQYPRRLRLFEQYLAVLEKLGASDAEAKIKAVSWVRGFNNYRTKHRGELEGMERGGLLAKKRAEEQKLRAAIAADASKAARYGKVIDQLEAALDEAKKTREADTALESEILMPRLLSAGARIVRMAEERARPDAEREPEYQVRNVSNLRDELKALDKLYYRKLDEAVLGTALERVLGTPAEERSPALELIAGKNPTRETIQKAVTELYARTKLADRKLRLALFERATSAQLAAHPDPMIRLGVALRPLTRAAELRRKQLSGRLLELKPPYMEALLALHGGVTPPDANGTLRVVFGTIKNHPAAPAGTSPRPFTVLSELVKKHTGQPPFDAPDRLLLAARERRFGAYVDPALGDVPVDFLSDVNITNGNSGSPTLNAKGELVGLAFDGSYDSVASDWLALPSTRSIHVDLRFALFVLDEVEHASALLQELGVRTSETRSEPQSSERNAVPVFGAQSAPR